MQMSHLKKIKSKIISNDDLSNLVKHWKKTNQKIVFTYGCFDIMHRGHVELLASAADLGDKLIIGLNSDDYIKIIKGENRPIIEEISRAILLSSLGFVDAIVFFSEKTPINLIKLIMPDILAKGGDYKINQIVGSDIVINNGGKVKILPHIKGYSTTAIINNQGKGLTEE